MDDEHTRVWREYDALLERSRQQFTLLRELPLYGRKLWERQYHEAFHLFASLWSFLQGNRYFPQTFDPNEEHVLLKEMRFRVRHIVVCLLLQKRDEARELLVVLADLVELYVANLQAADAREWQLVCEEVGRFIAADEPTQRPGLPQRVAAALSLRCQPASPLASVPYTAPFLRLQDAVLACYNSGQVKVAEMPLDTCRMMQAIEWEDPAASGSVSPDGGTGEWRHEAGAAAAPEPPAKCVLYRPSASHLLAVLATAAEALPPGSALLVYLSASGDPARAAWPHEAAAGDVPDGGASANSHSACGEDDSPPGLCLSPPSSSGQGDSWLYPEDLAPFTRRPLLIIVDSDNARAFQSLASCERSYPACCLMSPPVQPPEVARPEEVGRLFTMFLAHPALALCLLLGHAEPEPDLLSKLQEAVEGVLAGWAERLAGDDWGAGAAWGALFGDALCRRLIMRFALCRAVLALHTGLSRAPELQPTCFPALPEAVCTKAEHVAEGVQRIAGVLGCEQSFFRPGCVHSESFSERELWEADRPGPGV